MPSGNGWDCSASAGSNILCTTSIPVSAHQLYNTITIPARVTSLTFRHESYVNYAYVSNPFEPIGKRCRTDGAIPNPALGGANGQTPSAVCDEDLKNADSATINTASPTRFDLGLTKFVNGNDDSSRANADGSINYTFVVHNFGTLASTGRTTVRDTDFPTGISVLTVANQNGWSCTNTGNTVGNTLAQNGFECYRDDSLSAGSDYPVITVVAKLEYSASVGNFRNVACLSNPNDPHE